MPLPSSKTDAAANYAWVDGEDTPEATPHNAVLTALDAVEDVVGLPADTDGLVYKEANFGIKGWAVFDGTDADPITKGAGFNVSGTIAHNSTGNYTITWTTAFANTNYAVMIQATDTTSKCQIQEIITADVGSLNFTLRNTAAVLANYDRISVIAVGPQ